MRRTIVSICVVLVVIALISATSVNAIEIVHPSAGDTEVTITGFTVPKDLGGAHKSVNRAAAWLTVYLAIRAATGVHVDSFRTSSVDRIWTIALLSALAIGDYVVAVDNWNGSYTMHRVGDERKATNDPDFVVEGFEPGATEMRISGLPEGALLQSLYTTPGSWPSETALTDGSWGDSDGEVNGVIVASVPRFSGPEYVLPGETWTLAVEVEGEGIDPMVVTVVAGGLLTRHVVPVVSHIIGSTGVPFISDLSMSNPTGLQIDGWLRFVEEGGDIDSAPSVTFELPAGETVAWTDVLQSAFSIDDNVKGSLVIGGYPHWLLQVSSRNYAADADGRRFGIAVPGEPTMVPLFGQNPWIIPGLRQDEVFRSNLLLAGMAPTTSWVTIRLVASGAVIGETTRQIAPYALLQLNRIAETLGAGAVEQGHLEIEVDSGGVAAALAVVDGSADDAAYIAARPMFP